MSMIGSGLVSSKNGQDETELKGVITREYQNNFSLLRGVNLEHKKYSQLTFREYKNFMVGVFTDSDKLALDGAEKGKDSFKLLF
jgi:hypothetical protein